MLPFVIVVKYLDDIQTSLDSLESYSDLTFCKIILIDFLS